MKLNFDFDLPCRTSPRDNVLEDLWWLELNSERNLYVYKYQKEDSPKTIMKINL